MVDVPLDASWDNLDEAFASLENECADIIRGLTVEVWEGVLNRTPQWYGRMVVSYTYSLNIPITVDRSYAIGPQETLHGDEALAYVRSRGDQEAVDLANFFSLGKDKPYKLGDTVWITNGVDHGEGGYSQAIEDGLISLRSVNRPGAPAQRTLDSVAARYGKNISANRAAILKTTTISSA